MSTETVEFPFGKIKMFVEIPSGSPHRILAAKEPPGLHEEVKEIQRTLLEPTQSEPLHTLVNPSSKVALLVSDVTRPVPSYKILPPIIRELRKASLPTNNITIIVATGMHRSNTESELRSMLGKDVLDKFNVINHNALDRKQLTFVGKTSYGTPLEINSAVFDADVRITTGYIEPHEFAGFTGGRKSILPGISGINTINWNHRPDMISNPNATIGSLDSNPIHKDMTEAAEKVGIDFIVNVVLNSKKQTAKVVSGNFLEAHLRGVRFCEQYAGVKTSQLADIVVASSGYPLDIDLYQSIKSAVTAEHFVKEGGTIILLAECRDGVGPMMFRESLRTATSAEDLIQRTAGETYCADADHCILLGRILKKSEIVLVSSNVNSTNVNQRLIQTTGSVETALDIALKKTGRGAEIISLPYATRIIPLNHDKNRFL